jgi:hypothetical protein
MQREASHILKLPQPPERPLYRNKNVAMNKIRCCKPEDKTALILRALKPSFDKGIKI